LIIESYDAVGDQAERALVGIAENDHRGRWRAVCTAVRRWAVTHPQEFALIYGSPVPGSQAPADTVAPSSRVYMLLLGIVREGFQAGQLAPPPTEPPVRTTLAEDATALLSTFNVSVLPPAVLLRAMTSRTHVMSKRSVSMPYSGAHCAASSGRTMVEPWTSLLYRALISSASSPRMETKNGFSPLSRGSWAGTS
jgi:hypothetical protein